MCHDTTCSLQSFPHSQITTSSHPAKVQHKQGPTHSLYDPQATQLLDQNSKRLVGPTSLNILHMPPHAASHTSAGWPEITLPATQPHSIRPTGARLHSMPTSPPGMSVHCVSTTPCCIEATLQTHPPPQSECRLGSSAPHAALPSTAAAAAQADACPRSLQESGVVLGCGGPRDRCTRPRLQPRRGRGGLRRRSSRALLRPGKAGTGCRTAASAPGSFLHVETLQQAQRALSDNGGT